MPISQRWFENLHNFSYKIILKNNKRKVLNHATTENLVFLKISGDDKKDGRFSKSSLLDSECKSKCPIKLKTAYTVLCRPHCTPRKSRKCSDRPHLMLLLHKYPHKPLGLWSGHLSSALHVQLPRMLRPRVVRTKGFSDHVKEKLFTQRRNCLGHQYPINFYGLPINFVVQFLTYQNHLSFFIFYLFVKRILMLFYH